MSDRLTDHDVVTNMALVLKEFLNRMSEDFPFASCVYDEELSYETALGNWRAKQQTLGTNAPFLPAFIFRRAALRHIEHGVGRRAPYCKVLKPQGDNALLYKMVHGELEVNWMYVNEKMSELEKFEISYLAESGLAGNKAMNVLIPELGEFEYHINYDRDLSDKPVSHDDNYYKAVMGSARIRGFFFLFDQTSPLINQIGLTIQDFNNQVFLNTTINGA